MRFNGKFVAKVLVSFAVVFLFLYSPFYLHVQASEGSTVTFTVTVSSGGVTATSDPIVLHITPSDDIQPTPGTWNNEFTDGHGNPQWRYVLADGTVATGLTYVGAHYDSPYFSGWHIFMDAARNGVHAWNLSVASATYGPWAFCPVGNALVYFDDTLGRPVTGLVRTRSGGEGWPEEYNLFGSNFMSIAPFRREFANGWNLNSLDNTWHYLIADFGSLLRGGSRVVYDLFGVGNTGWVTVTANAAGVLDTASMTEAPAP